MHDSYAPGVNIRGGFAGGVPADLLSTARTLEAFTFVRSLRICNCRYVRDASRDQGSRRKIAQ
nr:hypothetical protein [Corynebacterium diphtheriae]